LSQNQDDRGSESDNFQFLDLDHLDSGSNHPVSGLTVLGPMGNIGANIGANGELGKIANYGRNMEN
jgi:hypothetical protein